MLLDLLAPPRCLACSAPGAGVLCAACRAELPWLGPACPRCALPSAACPPCPARGAAFAAAWAPVAMAGPARALVHALKLDGALRAADAIAPMLVHGLPAPDAASPFALVPVPPLPARARRRGFDHAAVLARALARRAGPAAPPVRACLERRGRGRQVGAGRQTRLAGPDVRAIGPVPARVVLVDDVHTTGGTLHACARALRAAGAREVRALTFARTLPLTRG